MRTTHRSIAILSAIAFAACGTAADSTGPDAASSSSTTSTSTKSSTKPENTPLKCTSASCSFVGRIDSVATVPTSGYYGVVQKWKVGGHIFQGTATSEYKLTNGALKVGACAEVDYYNDGTSDLIREMKSLLAARCP